MQNMSVYKNKTLILFKNKKKSNILSSIYENDNTESFESIVKKKYKLNNNKFKDKSSVSTSSLNLKLNSSSNAFQKKSNNSSKITQTKNICNNIIGFQPKKNLQDARFRHKLNIAENKKITSSKGSICEKDLKCKENKENKENQVTLVFNNILLNNYYYHNRVSILNCTQVSNQFLYLNCPYDPHLNYLKITNNKKDLVKSFLSQTSNNFFNKYRIIYSSANPYERKCIVKSFEAIKNDKLKNIDENHNIKNIVNRAINKYGKNLFLRPNTVNNKIKPINFDITPYSFVNTNELFKRNNNINIKSIKLANESFKNYKNSIDNHSITKGENKNNSILNKIISQESSENNFFQTLPKNLLRNRNDNIKDFINGNKLL